MLRTAGDTKVCTSPAPGCWPSWQAPHPTCPNSRRLPAVFCTTMRVQAPPMAMGY